MSEWIDVKKKLPKAGSKFISFNKIGYVNGYFKDEEPIYYVSASIFGWNGELTQTFGIQKSEITHWMPFPKPPRMKNQTERLS